MNLHESPPLLWSRGQRKGVWGAGEGCRQLIFHGGRWRATQHKSAIRQGAHIMIAALFLCGLAAGAHGKNFTSKMTFYGAKDNCPPGGAIADPSSKGRHEIAGGTAVDHITFAEAKACVKPGSIIYVPSLQNYFAMEECDHDWKSCEECDEKHYHFDLWMGPDTAAHGPTLIACENEMTDTTTEARSFLLSSSLNCIFFLLLSSSLNCIFSTIHFYRSSGSCLRNASAAPTGVGASVLVTLWWWIGTNAPK